jgi:hypothetical protein
MPPIGTWKVHKDLLEKIMDEMIIHEIIRWIIYKVKNWKISPENTLDKNRRYFPTAKKAFLENGRALPYFSVHFGLSLVFLYCLSLMFRG